PLWALAGQSVTVTAQMQDSAGNPAGPGQNVYWAVAGSGVSVVYEAAVTNDQGQAAIELAAAGSARAAVQAVNPVWNARIVSGSSAQAGQIVQWVQPGLAVGLPHQNAPCVAWGRQVAASTTTVLADGKTEWGVRVMGRELSGSAVPIAGLTVSFQAPDGKKQPVAASSGGWAQATWAVPAGFFGTVSWTLGSDVSSAGVKIAGSVDSGRGPGDGSTQLALPVQALGQSLQASLSVPSAQAAVGTDVPLVVKVDQAGGQPVAGQTIFWNVEGGGQLSGTSTTTNAQGISRVWLTGGSVGSKDLVIAQYRSDRLPLTQWISWQPLKGPSNFVLVGAQAGSTANTLQLQFDHTWADHPSASALIRHMVVSNVDTGAVYAVHHVSFSKDQAQITLDPSSRLASEGTYRVAIVDPTQVYDRQDQELAPSSAVFWQPSDPVIAATATAQGMAITLSDHGGMLPAGVTLAVVPALPDQVIGDNSPGTAAFFTAGASATSWTVSMSATAGAYTLMFDGQAQTVAIND
ncbi:MAG: Ig-like domain-containing protein, partial [Firmicutes bacterium]|nr:Ig-like domain-containing protein [Bacillota bacterium]